MAGADEGTTHRAVLVTSARAGHEAALAHAEQLLAQAGIRIIERVEVRDLPRDAGQGRHWREMGATMVIGAGGDGTLGTLATHLHGAGLPLGILPLGTSNDVARSLGLPVDVHEAVRVLRDGAPVMVDAGHAISPASEPLPPVFLHALTLGLNVDFARLATSAAMRREFGPLTYAVASIEALLRFHPVETTIRVTGGPADQVSEHTLRVVQVAVINTPAFAGALGFRVPGVDMYDQMLDALVIEAMEPNAVSEMAEALLSLARGEGNHVSVPGMRRLKFRELSIETNPPAEVAMDGELRGRTPLVVRTAPQGIPVIMPPGAGSARTTGD